MEYKFPPNKYRKCQQILPKKKIPWLLSDGHVVRLSLKSGFITFHKMTCESNLVNQKILWTNW